VAFLGVVVSAGGMIEGWVSVRRGGGGDCCGVGVWVFRGGGRVVRWIFGGWGRGEGRGGEGREEGGGLEDSCLIFGGLGRL